MIPAVPPRDRRRSAPARGRRDAVLRHRVSNYRVEDLAATSSARCRQTPSADATSATSRARGTTSRALRDRRARRSSAALPDACAFDVARPVRGRGGCSGALGMRIGARRSRPQTSSKQRRRRGPALERQRLDALQTARPRTLASDVAGGRCSPLGARAASCATNSGSCCAPTTRTSSTSSKRRGRGMFLRAAPIDVSADHPRAAARPHARDRPDVGDADRRRHVRLRARPARHRAARASCGCRRSSTSAAQAILYLPRRMPDPRSPEFADGGRPRGRRDPRRTRGRAFVLFTSYATLRAGPAAARAGARLPDARAGHGAALGAARTHSGRRRTPSCSPPRASGRASTSSAKR